MFVSDLIRQPSSNHFAIKFVFVCYASVYVDAQRDCGHKLDLIRSGVYPHQL